MSDLNVYSRLASARAAFGPVLKERTAKGAKFSYQYADLGSVIDATQEPLRQHGLIAVQVLGRDEGLVTVHTSLRCLDNPEDAIFSELSLEPVNRDPQGFGSAITYARRYSLLAVLGIAPEDDDAAAASKPVARGNGASALQKAQTLIKSYYEQHPNEERVSLRRFMEDRDMATVGEPIAETQILDLVLYLEGANG